MTRRSLSKEVRYLIFSRDSHRCCVCGRGSKDKVKLTVDHKVPLAKGGTDDLDNLWTLCLECNQGKRDLTVKLPTEDKLPYSFERRIETLFTDKPRSLLKLPSSIPFQLLIGPTRGLENRFSLKDDSLIKLMKFAPWCRKVISYPDYIQLKTIFNGDRPPEVLQKTYYVVREGKFLPEGSLYLWGEIQPLKEDCFDLMLLSFAIVDYILFLYRILLYYSWHGEVKVAVKIEDVSRKFLVLTPKDYQRRLYYSYQIPLDRSTVSVVTKGYFEENPEYIITAESSVFLFCEEILQDISHHFGLSDFKQIKNNYLNSILDHLDKEHFNVKYRDGEIILKPLVRKS